MCPLRPYTHRRPRPLPPPFPLGALAPTPQHAEPRDRTRPPRRSPRRRREPRVRRHEGPRPRLWSPQSFARRDDRSRHRRRRVLVLYDGALQPGKQDDVPRLLLPPERGHRRRHDGGVHLRGVRDHDAPPSAPRPDRRRHHREHRDAVRSDDRRDEDHRRRGKERRGSDIVRRRCSRLHPGRRGTPQDSA